MKMAEVMSRRWWSIFCLFVGGGRLIILLVNGFISPSSHLRCLASFETLFFRHQILLGFVLAKTFGTSLAVYPVVLTLEIYHAIQCARLARVVDQK